jgi:nicotinate-nucleotide adenylyltransferase
VDATTLPDRVELVDTPLIEVSSTFIRQALKEGKDVRYFLHPAVYEALKGTGR